jgi:Leucine-rich repeat (LRR) protein
LLGRLPALSSLVLSFNNLTGLDDLLPHSCSACQLTSLDVCHNRIASWQGRWLAGCSLLAVLDASYNSLSDTSHLQQLTRWVCILIAALANGAKFMLLCYV